MSIGRRFQGWSRTARRVVLFSGALALLLFQYVEDVPAGHRQARIAVRVPVQAAQWIAREKPPGRMWNAFNFGGYLLYAFNGAPAVSIDGRTGNRIYAQDHLVDSFKVSVDDGLLRRKLEENDVSFAVVDVDGFGDRRWHYLQQAADWSVLYWDDAAAVLGRRTADNQPWLERHAYTELRLDTALSRVRNIANDSQRDILLAELERNTRDAPDSIRAWWLLALARKQLGDMQGTKAAYDRAQAIALDRVVELPPL